MICPACHSDNTFSIDTYTVKGYSFKKCGDCEVIFADPMKAGTPEWYEKQDFYHQRKEPKKKLNWYEKYFLTRPVNSQKNKLLNIGCGYSPYLQRAQQKGYDVTAIDINESTITFTREILGIEKAHTISIEEFIKKHKHKMFDVVTFFEVIEHLEKPGEFLRDLNKLVKPGGIIVFSIPNRERTKPRMHWADYPPHHLTRWNKKSVCINLEKAGFTVEESLISTYSAEQLMYAVGIYFGTLHLKKMMDNGNNALPITLLYTLLLKFRALFYNLLVLPVKRPFKNKGYFLYTIGKKQ